MVNCRTGVVVYVSDSITPVLNQPQVSKSINLLIIGHLPLYFGRARSKGFVTLRNVSKLPFFDNIGHAKSVGFRFYSAI